MRIVTHLQGQLKALGQQEGVSEGNKTQKAKGEAKKEY